MIKVAIVDDHKLLLESLKYILSKDPSIEITGVFTNGNAILNECAVLPPDIILMDLKMPELDGMRTTRIIKEKYPKVKIIILTTFEDEKTIIDSFANDVQGYLVKNTELDKLIFAIKAVDLGFCIVPDTIRDILKRQIKNINTENKNIESLNLSSKEVNIIKLISEGKSNREIAIELHYSEGTVKNIISGLLNKMKVADRTQIVVYSLKNNII